MLRLDAMKVNRLTLLAGLMLAILVSGGCRRSPEARKAKFMASGEAFMKAKDYPRAILQFRNAAAVAGKDSEPYYQLALAFLADGQVQSGVGLLRSRQLSAYRPAKLKLAELEAMSTRKEVVQQAEGELEKMVSPGHPDADVLSALAFSEFRLGKEDEALQHLHAALENAPDNLKALVTMAKVKATKRDFNGAEQLLKTAVQKLPKSPDPLVALASFYLSTQKLPEAEQALQHALQIDPKSDAALFGLAAVQIRGGHKDKAELAYARLAALPPARYKPLHAQYLYREGKRDAAIAEFAKLVKDHPDDRSFRTLLVEAYELKNQQENAKKVLTDALKHNPKDVDALIQRAGIEMIAADYPKAQLDVEQALRYRPESPIAHYIRARVYRSRGDLALEIQELSEALRLDSSAKMLPARLELAQALMRQQNPKAALALFDVYKANEPGKPSQMPLNAFVMRNYVLLELKDFELARKYVDAALAKVRTPDLLLQDAEIKLDGSKKDYPGARASLEAVLKINPQDLRAVKLLADTYKQQNQLTLGTQKIRELSSGQPKSAVLQKFLGDWLASTGDHNGAIQAYAAAKQQDPKFTAADIAMVRVYMTDHKPDAARPILAGVLQTTKTNAEAFLFMAVIDDMSGNFKDAASNYHAVLGLQPNNQTALNNLAFLLAEHGKPQELDEALKLAQQVRALVPDSSNVDDTMGWVFYKKEIYSSAVQQFEDAVRQDERAKMPSPLHKYHLAMAYLKMKDYKRANDELQAALKLNPNLPEAKKATELLAQAKTAAN
jgi:tetratricopeptide (TPR) repeat protein